MSEQDVLDATQDFGDLDTQVCHRCAQHGRTDCDIESARQVLIQTARNITRDEVIHYLKTSWGTDYVTDERIESHMFRPKYENIAFDVCDNWLMTCEWCDDHYVEAVPEHDSTFETTERYWGTHLDWSHSDRLCTRCAEEAYICDRCSDLIHSDEIVNVEWDYVYCDSCASRFTTWCDDCDMRFQGSHSDCPEASNRRIHDYSFHPSPNFQWVVDVDGNLANSTKAFQSTPFMGFELEVEVRGGDFETALDICDNGTKGYAYYKNDGSLDCGFEIVSHPMTLAAHKALIDWDFLSKLSDAGVLSWNTRTCGFHVHISRSAFATPKHLAMFQFLILNNKNHMTTLAGRDSERWAAFDGVKQTVIPSIKGRMYRGRYEAINVLNSDTLEIRMFRGSLKRERVLMYLELVNAAYHYTRTMTAGDYAKGATQFHAFAAWCLSRGEEYAHLNEFIVNM